MTRFRPVVGSPHPISEIVLIPSDHGRFEISVGDELIYSKADTGQHPDPQVIGDMLAGRLGR